MFSRAKIRSLGVQSVDVGTGSKRTGFGVCGSGPASTSVRSSRSGRRRIGSADEGGKSFPRDEVVIQAAKLTWDVSP